MKQERKKDQFKDVILSWPTLPASRCSVTLSNGLPIKKRVKKCVCVKCWSTLAQQGFLTPQYSVLNTECQAGSQEHRTPGAGSKKCGSSLRVLSSSKCIKLLKT